MMQRMGSRLRFLGFAALALLVSGCGTIKYMQEMPAGTAVKAPAPGKAMVVFMRRILPHKTAPSRDLVAATALDP